MWCELVKRVASFVKDTYRIGLRKRLLCLIDGKRANRFTICVTTVERTLKAASTSARFNKYTNQTNINIPARGTTYAKTIISF